MKRTNDSRSQLGRDLLCLLAGALLALLLPGCAADTSVPVVTEDDLTPASAAQDALRQEAGSGKTYRYFWPPEDPARAEEEARSLAEAQLREQFAKPGNADEATQAFLKERQQAVAEQFLSDWAAQGQQNPAVPAQEAANLAGRALEQVYGVDLSEQELVLDLAKVYASVSADGPVEAMVWRVTDPQRNRFLCEINAETAAWVYLCYEESGEELAAAAQTPRASCCHALSEAGGALVWDPDSPAFAPLTQTMMDEACAALSGSLLVNGAQVTGAEYLPPEPYADGEERPAADLHFVLSCDDGRAYHLCGGSLKFYPEYDCGGYPLRAYTFSPVADDPEDERQTQTAK